MCTARWADAWQPGGSPSACISPSQTAGFLGLLKASEGRPAGWPAIGGAVCPCWSLQACREYRHRGSPRCATTTVHEEQQVEPGAVAESLPWAPGLMALMQACKGKRCCAMQLPEGRSSSCCTRYRKVNSDRRGDLAATRVTKKPLSVDSQGLLWLPGTVCDRLEWSVGGEEEDRTPDLRIANAALSQLSYPPNALKSIARVRRCYRLGP